ncbi:hypothetical protein L6164_010250 [Bauhinia variegata]|uniref:Uncharacterized protein n=1 Tax=Bauhinia variegata TaxID=167791 RepID=A0ACB9PMP0_BAUVA|nr:hypothetical protein L6164_010250 [Bauhinia variegata]
MNVVGISSPRKSEAILQNKNGSVWTPKVNGKHNKDIQHVSLKGEGELLQGNRISRMIQVNIPRYTEVLPSWQAQKIASWQNLEGHSIQWFCVVCIDRRGIIAEVTTLAFSFTRKHGMVLLLGCAGINIWL